MDSKPIKDISWLIRKVEGATTNHGHWLISQNLNKGDTLTLYQGRSQKNKKEKSLSNFIHLQHQLKKTEYAWLFIAYKLKR